MGEHSAGVQLKPIVPRRKKYLRKNTETNISNQAFSFVCTRSKSSTTLRRLLRINGQSVDDLLDIYYSYTKVMKRNRRKYINKQVLAKFAIDTECDIIREVANSPVYTNKLPIQSFCKLVRTLLRYFLIELCQLAVVTSKKLFKETEI